VCSRNDIYLSGGSVQATLRNTVAIVLSAAVIIRKGGSGQWHYAHWSGGQRAAPRCLPVSSKHGACCIINPTDAKAQFPALSPGHRTLAHGDIIIRERTIHLAADMIQFDSMQKISADTIPI